MLGIIGILAAAKRLLGIFLQIKFNGLYSESPIGNFQGSQNVLSPNEWSHIAMSVSGNVATYYINGKTAGGSPGVPAPIIFPDAAKLQNVNYLLNTSVNINANSYLGANNKTFIDRSPVSSNILTTSGTLVASGVTLGSFSPYSNQEWSAQFTGTDYLSVNCAADQFAFENNDATIEFWAYATSDAASEQVLLDFRTADTTEKRLMINVDTNKKLNIWYQGLRAIIDTNNFPINRWNHIAFVNKENYGCYLFLNGVKLGEYDNISLLPTTTLTIGRAVANRALFTGYISNLRIMKGVALYSNNFKPTSQALKLLPQKEIKTQSLIFPEGGSARLNTSSINMKSLKLDDFAVEMWIYKTVTGQQFLIDGRAAVANENNFHYYINSNEKVTMETGNATGPAPYLAVISNTTIELNKWYHLRFARDNQGYKLYVNGILDGEQYFSEKASFSVSEALTIGSRIDTQFLFKGYISNLRIVKGSTINYPSITPPSSSLQIVGTSATNYTGVFNGSSYLSGGVTINTGTNDFTVECFAYINNPAANGSLSSTIVDMRAAGAATDDRIQLLLDAVGMPAGASRLSYVVGSGAAAVPVIKSTIPMMSGNWYHLALARNSGIASLYINGKLAGSAANASNMNHSNIFLGVNRARTGGYFNGYISNFRYVNNTAVYTTEFTRPSADLTAITDTSLLTLQTSAIKDNSTSNYTLNSQGNFTIAPQNFFEEMSNNYSIRTTTVGGINGINFNPPISLRNSEFTLEFFLYVRNVPAAQVNFFGTDFYLTTSMILTLQGLADLKTKLLPKRWYHIALVKTLGKATLFVDGKIVGEAFNFAFVNSAINDIGSINIANGLDGHITDYRLVAGALYYTNFTPPVSSLPVLGDDITNGYSALFDGNAATDISNTNITGGLLDFGSGPGTIEFFINTRYPAGGSSIWNMPLGAQNNFLFLRADGILEYYVGTVARIVTTTALVQNTWHHIALVRISGLDVRLYINGVQSGGTYTTCPNWVSTSLTIRGGVKNKTYMRDFRISSAALYNGTFTPPTSSLPVLGSTRLLILKDQPTSNAVGSPIVDNAGVFTGTNSLIISVTPLLSSTYNPFDSSYTPNKTCLLISARNQSISDLSYFNYPVSGVSNTYYHNNNPWIIKPIRTTLLSLTSNSISDASGHVQLSSVNTTFSAVDPFSGSGSSVIFSGNGYLSAKMSGIFINDDDFTLETWFYQTSAAAGTILDTNAFGSNTGGYIIAIDATNRITFQSLANTTVSVKGPTIKLGKWYHLAISRKAGVKSEYFLDGKYIGSDKRATGTAGVFAYDDINSLFNPTNFVIGALNTGGAKIVGLMSNFRIIKGLSQYNFFGEQLFLPPTTETEPFPEVLPTSYSQYFSGSATSYLSGAARSSEFSYGLSSFTIEMWIYPQSDAFYYLLDHRNSSGSANAIKFSLRRTSQGRIELVEAAAAAVAKITSSIPTPINEWSHIALSRQSGSGMSLYINGLSAGYYNDSAISWANDGLSVGGSSLDTTGKFNGYISNFRITKNAALYSGYSFEVPTSPLAPVPSYPLDKYSTIFNSSKKTLITIDTRNYSGFDFGTGSFCVEFFAYAFNADRLVTLYDSRDQDNLNGNFLRIERRADNKITCYVAGVSTITSTQNISAGRWYHIAYQRTAGLNSTLYIDGVSNGTRNDQLSSYAKVNYVYVGGVSITDIFDGCISNLRISNSIIYNSNFPVPVGNLTSSINTKLLLFQDNNLLDASSNPITTIYNIGGTYLTTNGLNPFYPKDSARTILLTLQDATPKDNAFVFTESYALSAIGLAAQTNNPFNNSTSNELLIGRSNDDFKSYGLSALNNAGNSYKNPLDPTLITSFLALNSERYKDSSIYNAPLANTPVTTQTRYSNFSPFLNLTPYTSANGGSIYFDNTSTKFLLVSSKGLVTKFGTNDFTIEFWLYKNTTATSQMMIFDTMSALPAASPGHMQIYLDSANKVVFYAGGMPIITSSRGIPAFSWQHIAVARKAAITTLYINGIANSTTHGELNVGSVSTNFTNPEYFAIGSGLRALNTNTLTGYITDFHIVSGSCLYKSNFSPPIEPLSSFSNTTLLINALNAGVVDTTGKFNLFTGGNVSISNDVPNISASASTGTLSAGSMYFDGSNNSFVFTDSNNQYFNLSGAYTAELWVKPTTTPNGSAVLFSVRNTDTDKLVLAIDNNRRIVYRSTNSTAVSSITSADIPLNQWSHIVITRALSSGTTYKTTLYVNGTNSGFTSASIANTNKLLNIGSDNNNNRFTGYIDDFKIVKEVMERYSSTVAVPLRESEIQNNLKYPDLDYLDQTKLIINADTGLGVNNNIITDESSNALNISKTGTVYQGSVTVLSPGFGYNPAKHAGSIYLDGSSHIYINDLLKLQQKPFNLSKDYTIEAWVKPLNTNSNPPIFDTRNKGISARIGSTFKEDSNFKGYIAGVKTSKGVSRYNSNFTLDMVPPTTDSNTSLLLNFRQAGIIDSMSKNNIATIGSAVLSFEKKKFTEGGSVYFDGGGYLAMPENSHFLITNNDFTIEWHMYLTSNYENYGIFTTVSPETSTTGHLYITFKNNALCLGTYGGQEVPFHTCTGILDEWMHVAVVRENGNCRVYRNGIFQESKPFSTNVAVQNGAFIGKTYNAPMYGYIDEFRFTNGVCRHTQDFNPDASFSALIDANDTQYTEDTSTIILDPPRYPTSNVLDDYLASHENKIMVDYIIVAGGGAGGGTSGYGADGEPNTTSDSGLVSGGSGGGGGGEVKFGSFDCDYNIMSISIGAGGTCTSTYNNFVASTNGTDTTVNSSTINIIASGGGRGASYFTRTTYFLAGNGGNGGGSFHFDTTITPLNVGGTGIMSNGETSALASCAGSGGGASFTGINNNINPFDRIRVSTTDLTIIGVNNGGAGITWPLSISDLSLTSFGGGGQGGVRVRAPGSSSAATTYALIPTNAWGGGGLKGSSNDSGIQYGWGTYGISGKTNTGGGGGGSFYATRRLYGGPGGNGGSGCAIFRVPAVLNDSFLTTGGVERVISGEYAYLIFKSSGTLQFI